MKAFMTTGTFSFLIKLLDKYPHISFSLMSNATNTLLYYEDEKKNVFASGRAYEVLTMSGQMQKEGYVSMNHIPVADEGKPVFEDHFKRNLSSLQKCLGFQAFRLLKPRKGNMYVVITQWDSEKSFKLWKSSESYTQLHDPTKTMPPAYFLERPFHATYTMTILEE